LFLENHPTTRGHPSDKDACQNKELEHFPTKSRISEPAPRSKSILVLFFRKEQDSSFSEEKEAKRLLLSCIVFENPGLGRIATSDPYLPE
jgi:hypothetical protein